ncbi:DUF484 family protein [Orbaceae bacterium ESL0721]|nr:DUF484 family protein [Orbaceae bacterium ESL0721]
MTVKTVASIDRNGEDSAKSVTSAEDFNSSVNTIDEETICHYLLDHPDFFIRHAKQLESIQIPHPIREAVSLPEWHMARQRNKIEQLESEITLLMEHASTNEALADQLQLLQNQMIIATDLNHLSEILNRWTKLLGLSGAYLYLFDDKWQLNAPLNYHHFTLNAAKFNFIRVRHLQYSYQYLGRLNSTELDFLLPPTQSRAHIGSVALSLFGEFGDLGLLMFTSRHQDHYQTGQGTWLIEKISETLPILISRWIKRRA